MKETPKHIAAYTFYRDMDKRSLAKVATKFRVSETSVNKWNKAFKWQRRIAAWDTAIREGVEERAIEAVVEHRINEIEHLDKAMTEIDTVMPLIFDALQSCAETDPQTGKKRVKIIPETTQDMAALYNAQARFVAMKVKLVETVRKVIGEPDKVEIKSTVAVTLNDTLKEYESVIKRISASDPT